MNMTSRRGFIKSAPIAALAATTAPALAYQAPVTETPEPDPIRKWLDQWKQKRADCLEVEEGSAEEAALWDRTSKLELRIYTTQAKTADGVAAQIEWFLADSVYEDFQVGHREVLELALVALKGGIA